MRKLCCVVLGIVISFLLPTIASAQKNSGTLQMRISTDKRCYTPNETIKVSIRFVNTDAVPIYLYHFDKAIYRTDIGAYDSDGNLTGAHSDPIYFRSVRPRTAKDFIRIAPGKSYRQIESFFLYGKRTGEDGEYSLAAFYRSPVGEPPSELRGKRVWTSGDGPVSSGSVSIQRLGLCPARIQ
jgi:hypothetical protein